MRIGVGLPNTIPGTPGPRLVEWARAAEEMGFSTLATIGRLVFPTYEELQALTGRRLKLGHFPWWMIRLAAPVWELGRELGEMRYLYDTPHSLSGARLQALLPGFRQTPLSEVLRAVLARREGFAPAA